MNKKIAAIGVGTAAVAATLLLRIPGTGVDIKGTYKIENTSSVSSKIVVELPYEQVPNATFYSVTFGNSELGISPFGESFGINTAKGLLNPPTRLGVIVYDKKREPIGNGVFAADGSVIVSIEKSEVAE